MASRSYPEEDFRRRPGRSKTGNTSRIDEEVENRSTEVAEEQADDLDDDPLVLKGSRPTGPQKKLPQGAEDWGIDDDGDWGSKTNPSRPKKETQEQRIQRVMTPGIFEIVTAFFLHLTVLGFYVYVHVYDGTVYKRNKGMGFIGSDKFGGRWKSLTYINMWLQLVYFFLAFLCDIMPMSYAKQLLAKFRDFLFTTVAFPMAIFVCITFWGIYTINRESIHPAEVDEFIPQLLNHFWHTTIIIPVLLEVLLVFHRYPNTLNAVAVIFTVCTAYIIWYVYNEIPLHRSDNTLVSSPGSPCARMIMVVFVFGEYWVYPFLEAMSPYAKSVFFAGCFVVTLIIYSLGYMIAYWRWKERHLLIKELRL